MNIKAEDIVELFDEFYLIDEPLATAAKLQQPVTLLQDIIPNKQTTEVAENLSKQVIQIVSAEKKTETIEAKLVTPLFYSGANKKHITFIYNDKISDTKDNVELIMNVLTKVLKINLEDIAMVRLSKNNLHTLPQIMQELNPKKAILWGCQELLLAEGVSYELHTTKLAFGVQLLFADKVHHYHGNDSFKKDLLSALINWNK